MKYKDAGVDIEAGERLVKRIEGLARSTSRPGVLSSIGGFGGLFRFPVEKYRNPVLVAGTDGVGTKVKVANLSGRFDTVGIDLVAMCVNDLLTSGAEPLFFLDYLAVSKLKLAWAEEVIKGVARGCQMANCALLGGETAELPGIYAEGEYDLVGFALGVVEKERIIDGSRVKAGDRIIGLASSGLHSNGYSLARKVFDLDEGEGAARLNGQVEGLERTLGEELLEPTRIYVKPILKILEKFEIRGLAHITGGGLVGNIPRLLPAGCRAIIHKDSWRIPPLFGIIQKEGNIPDEEMFRVFNMGIGMAAVIPGDEVEGLNTRLGELGETSYLLGEIEEGSKEVEII